MTISVHNQRELSPALTRFLEKVDSSVFSMTFDFPQGAKTLDAELESITLGNIRLLSYKGHGLQKCAREREHILVDGSDDFFLCLPQRSEYGIRYAGVEAKAPSNSLVFLAADKPFHAYVDDGPAHAGFMVLYVRVPGPLLRRRVPCIDKVCGRFVTITPGIVHAMHSGLHIAREDGPYLSEEQADILSNCTLELICQAVQHTLGNDSDSVIRQSSAEQTLRRAKAFIDANLSDHDLCFQMVADHCRVSTRYLNKVFAMQATSAMAFIRETRLQRCRETLSNSNLSDLPIAEIAARWGFTSLSHFSQAYKSRFGIPPSAERKVIKKSSGHGLN